MDGACSLLFMLPNDWKHVVSQSCGISNTACFQPRAKAKAKAKAKPRSTHVYIVQIPVHYARS